MRTPENRSTTAVRPALPSASRKAQSRASRSSPRANARTSPGGTSTPAGLSPINSGSPPTANATTGNPAPIASSALNGSPSWGDDKTSASAAARSPAVASWYPTKRTADLIPSDDASWLKLVASRPSPARTNTAGTPASRTRAAARIARSILFSGTRRASTRPTKSPSPTPSRARTENRISAEGGGGGASPLWITSIFSTLG